jgi:1,4-dihydroxy-2-naphthoyl-CoA hydrolase
VRDFPAVPGASNPKVTPEVSRRALADSFPGRLGIELVEITDEHVLGRLPVDERHLHPGGYVHGGVWVAFGDTVAAWGTLRRLPPGNDFTTIELKTNVFAAARAGDVLTAEGVPEHVGRRTQVWRVEVSRGDRRAALFVCTQMILPADEANPVVDAYQRGDR